MPPRYTARASRKQRFVRPAARRLSVTATRPPPRPPAGAALRSARPSAPARSEIPSGVTLTLARPGDLPALPTFFAAAGVGPSASEMAIQWDAPEPLAPRRVLARRGSQLVGHLAFSLLPLQVGGRQVAAALLRHLTLLPEHDTPGMVGALLSEAEAKARDAGAAAAIFAGGPDALTKARGWRALPPERRWDAPAARLLARLETLRRSEPAPRPPLLVRPWRLVELAALVRIYAARAAGRPGACVRDEVRWNWLLNRQTHDRIYLALEGPDRGSFDDINARVRAYLTLRGQQVVEVAAERGREEALLDLLARACGDALESRTPMLRYEGAADDTLGALFGSAAEPGANEPLPRRAIKALTPAGVAAVDCLTTLWRPPVWDELEAR